MERGALDLAAVCRVAAPGIGIIFRIDLRDAAIVVLFAAGAGDEISALQAALRAAGEQTLILGHRRLQKVLALHIKLPGEGDGMGAVLGAVGVVFHLEGLALPLGIVGNDQLHGPQHRHHPAGVLVQILPQAVLQEGVFHRAGNLGHADALAEIADGGGGIASPAQAAEGWHPGIVPAGDLLFLHQLTELALGHDGMVDAQPGKLDLPGLGGDGNIVDDPIIQGAMVLIFQRAEGVGDVLQRVLNRMGKIIHGEDAPFGALPVVLDVADPIDHRIPHIEVAGGQVDLGPQGIFSLGKLAVFHPFKQLQALLHRPVPPRADGRMLGVAAVFGKLLRRQLADIGQTLSDQLHGVFIVLLEIIGAVKQPVAPVEAQPVDILLNGLHKLGVLLGGVGVVKAQVAQAAKLFRRAEVDAQGLAVADVQIAVGLRREPGVDLFARKASAGGDILLDELLDKIAGGAGGLDLFFHI